MKIGIISDSHDHHKNAAKAAEVFRWQKVNYIFHSGDMISASTAKTFAKVAGARLIAVFGNCDKNRVLLAGTIEGLGGKIYDCYTGRIAGKRIFMKHQLNAPDEVADTGKYNLVIYGHTHKQDIHKVGETLVINPGLSGSWWMGNPQVVVVELDDMSYEVIVL